MTDAAIAPAPTAIPVDEQSGRADQPKPRVNVPMEPKTWTTSKKIEMLVRWKIGTAILRIFGINGA